MTETTQKVASQSLTKGQVFTSFIRLIWRLQPSIFLWLLLGALIGTVQALFTAAIPKLLIDAYQRGYDTERFLLLIAAIVAGKWALLQLTKMHGNRQERQNELLTQQVVLTLAEKIARIDYSNLEDPKVLDLKERGQFALVNYGALFQLFDAGLRGTTGLLTVVGVTMLLVQFSSPMFSLILLLTLLSTALSIGALKRLQQLMQNLIPVNRIYSYFFNKTFLPDLQKEFRILSMFQLMDNRIRDLNKETFHWLGRMRSLEARTSSVQAVLQYLTAAVAMIYGALRVQGRGAGRSIGIGDFTFYVGISLQFSTAVFNAGQATFQVVQAMDMLTPLAAFMAIPDSREKSGHLDVPNFESLAFHDVTFRYPGSDRPVLENVSFEIRRGEHISIVGLNNAGKTTIVKLICRLFEPESGQILYNGVPIEEYDYGQYMARLSAVFQDFKFYPFTLRENLDPQGRYASDDEIFRMLDAAGVGEKVRNFPYGLDSYLDKSLRDDAVECSGGERQKLAIARAMLKQSELLILDEPTAALDPLAESEIYRHFAALTEGRTAIFISHRMSSSVFCDKILVIDRGQVVAFDTHENLMASDNLYRRLFLTQAAGLLGNSPAS
ncbi:MAG TPA: ABC transporter ATP-binding protein [Firmicutes bacterium]|nr:ABC transporter ATP-binding protein [Bacillota bacterium]